MKMMNRLALSTAALVACAPAAFAQTAAPAPAAPPAAAPAPAATSFSDDDLKKFASAAIEINKIQADAAVADKQPKMLAVVQASGLPPEKFNQIAQAAQSDPALQQKIQAAASASAPTPAAPPAEGAAPAPAQTPQ